MRDYRITYRSLDLYGSYPSRAFTLQAYDAKDAVTQAELELRWETQVRIEKVEPYVPLAVVVCNQGSGSA